MVAATGLFLCILLATAVTWCTFVLARRYASRVEHSSAELPDKLHNLQRASLIVAFGGLIVGAALFAAPIAVVLLTHRPVKHHSPAGTTVAWYIVGYVVAMCSFIAPVIAGSKAIRRSYARLRKVDLKQPGTRRRLVVGLAIGGAFGLLYGVISAVLPKHGAAHSIGLLLAYVVALFVVQTLCAPLYLRALRAQPLPPATRTRLLALADQLGVRVRDIKAFPGRRTKVANAVQIGLLPRLRYILVTDYLVDNVTDDELDAVVAHELGHARGHHLAVKLGAIAATWLGFEAIAAGIGSTFHGGAAVVPLIAFPIVFPVAFILVQGVIGVRLEERADASAARAVGAEHLATALERIGELNDTKRRTGRAWSLLTQHPGLQTRINRLRNANEQNRPTTSRRVEPRVAIR
jgi:STE24 endopeptidase